MQEPVKLPGRIKENDMTKSNQLKMQLKQLDSALVAESARGGAMPVAPKTDDGGDRYGGFPPALPGA